MVYIAIYDNEGERVRLCPLFTKGEICLNFFTKCYENFEVTSKNIYITI